MTEIRSINSLRAEREQNNSLVTPLETLQDAVNDVRTGRVAPDSLLVIYLTRGEEGRQYQIDWLASKLSGAEMLGLAEAFKATVLRDMGFIPDR